MAGLLDPAVTQDGVGVSDANIERHLRLFRPAFQTRVRTLASAHPWLTELAASFPALLFALACPRAGVDTQAARRLVVEGAPLSWAGRRAGLPLWLRRAPPQAFDGPIPLLPDSRWLRRRMPNHFPPRWADLPRWMAQVSEAGRWGDDELAVWFARCAPVRSRRRRTRRGWGPPLRLLCLWGWQVRHAEESSPARPAVAWRPDMSWTAALRAASAWRNEMDLHLYLGDGGVRDAWVAPGTVDGFTFTALRTAGDLKEEAAAMRHCVNVYGRDLADNFCRLWSIRRDGVRVATLALTAPGPLPQISELRGVMNQDAPLAVWLAARRWLHAQDAPNYDAHRLDRCHGAVDPRAWRRLWKPYWRAKGRIPEWLPLTPTSSWPVEAQ